MTHRTLRFKTVVTRNDVQPDEHNTLSVAGNKVGGSKPEEDARKMQSLKYSEDKVKFNEKEKEKAKKKRVEKLQRYSHVDFGRKMSDDPSNDLETRQNTLSASAVKMKQNKDKKMNECGQIVIDKKLSNSTNTIESTQIDEPNNSVKKTKEKKEEEFYHQMRAARERFQKRYDEEKNRNL